MDGIFLDFPMDLVENEQNDGVKPNKNWKSAKYPKRNGKKTRMESILLRVLTFNLTLALARVYEA